MYNYNKKYLKYKQKYLKLKNKKYFVQKGGAYIQNHNNINRFSIIKYPDMEEFLNPIYGCFLEESNFIKNNYFLYKEGIDPGELKLNDKMKSIKQDDQNIPYFIINNNLRKKISELVHNIEYMVQPIKQIINGSIKAVDIGRFIAILYFSKMNNLSIKYDKKNLICWFDNGQTQEKADKNTLQLYVDKIYNIQEIKKNIQIGTKDRMDFHLLLYCLWNIINDDNTIDEYYSGIQDIFNITNKYSSNIYNICSNNDISEITFEKAVIKTITTDFIVFNQGYARSFCYTDNIKDILYPDCGETTIRNLINLLCFDTSTSTFDIDILNEYSPIDELIDYYKTFPNFAEQSSNNKKKIYGLKLNARDAWSYLIIYYANNNLTFNDQCSRNISQKFNLRASSETPDKNNINSLQLIKNLLRDITVWSNLVNSNILEINSNLSFCGIGTIIIKHKSLGNITIEYIERHAYWQPIKKQNKITISHLSLHKQIIINILKNEAKITESNYLFFKYNENIISKLNISYSQEKLDLIKNIFELSLTNIITKEIRKQINIDTENKYIMEILKLYNYHEEINEYNYQCNNFDFITTYIPQLKKLNSHILNRFSLNSIILTPLYNITSIGNNFLSMCVKLKQIDLIPLYNITSIGNNFLKNCYNLEQIDLSPLCNVITIGDCFLAACKFNIIDLSPLCKVKIIGDNFLSSCDDLTSIDLTPLSNIISIGHNFISDCGNINIIDLSPLLNIISIGDNFLSDCSQLKTVIISKEQEKLIKPKIQNGVKISIINKKN